MSFLKGGTNNKNWLYFTYLPINPNERISNKFSIAVEVADVITFVKIFGNQLRDVNFVGGGLENGGFPLTKPLAVNTLLAQLRSE